jgi:hypothetical protein
MSTMIMSDAAIAMLTHEEHLILPIVAIQRPSMAEDDH